MLTHALTRAVVQIRRDRGAPAHRCQETGVASRSAGRRCLTARLGTFRVRRTGLQLLRSPSSSVQASVRGALSENDGGEVQQWLTQVFQNKNRSDEDEEELQQWVRQTFQDAGSSLEETSPDRLLPIVKFLMEHDCNKAAVMVINAMLVSTPDDVYLIKSRSRLEAEFDLSNALRSLSELINLGVADASDYLLYGQLLYSVEKDQQAAGDALSHALAICEPSDRFDMLVTCANSKGVMGDLQGALEYFAEADSLGQLNFNDLKRLGELQVIVGDRAAALDPLNRAAAMEPNNASVRQQQGACKLFAEDHAGAVADLDAAILHGERSTLTYRCRGIANLRLGQLDTALADLDQAVAEESEQQHLCEALVWRAEVKHELANHMDAVADMDRASNIQPLAYHHQFQHFHYRQLAKGAASSEDIPGARQDVSNANVQQHPDAELAQTLTNQGRTLCENHRFEAALAALNKADNLRPNKSDTLVWRGTAKLCLDNCAGAVADYDAAEQQAPLEEHVLAKRLVAKLNLGTLGLEDVQKADEKKALLKAEKTQGSWFTDQV